MNNDVADIEAARMVERLRDATNDHDAEGVAACFTSDYRSQTPAHPARDFIGRDQVRNNQKKIFSFVPDITVELLRSTVDGNTSGRSGSIAALAKMVRCTTWAAR